MVTVTGFRAGDTRAVVDLWCRSAPADPITQERFRNLVLLDANFDAEGLRVARDGDRLLGAAYAVRRKVAMVGDDLEPTRGWVPFFFVDPAHRRSGVGRALLESARDWLREKGAHEVFFSSYTPNYILPGCDRQTYPAAAHLLESLGWKTQYEAVAMDRSLVGYAIPDDVAEKIAQLRAAGWYLDTPTLDDLPPLVRLASEHFNPDWARAIRECLVAGLPVDRIVMARDPAGAVIGWAMHGAYEAATERFGPFGVLETQRGLGLGKVLLHLTLARMRALGAHGAWFLWTGEESPAGHLYLKTGFTISRRFDVMRASL
jgi:GNAT superfamily N-acetyltransferase